MEIKKDNINQIRNQIIRLLLLYAIVFISNNQVSAQNLIPKNGHVFKDKSIPRIDIVINQDTLDYILDPANADSYQEFRATFYFNREGEIDTLPEVGFRLRGNTSRHSQKKSFKVSFNTFMPGREYYGLEKMNLNGEHNDPSIARSKICWDILREFGCVGSRSNHVELYINGEYKGLYINVEHTDEEFVGKRYGNKDGNLYKCLWPADLNYISTNPNDYMNEAYELKTNTAQNDYSDLADFIDILNNTPITQLPAAIEQEVNMHSVFQFLTLEFFLGHWDGYSYNKNNFYLYHNTATDKFEIITYDLDNTLGIDWIGRDWASRDIYDWASHGEYRPLVERIFEVPEYKDWFSLYMFQMLNSVADISLLNDEIENFKNNNRNLVLNDTYYPRDYGWDIDDYELSFSDDIDPWHVDYGIKPYIITRCSTANQQLQLPESFIVINEIISNNMASHADENQEFDDWIELYNPSNQDFNMADCYITDDVDEPMKWKLPEQILNQGEYLIIWADKDSLFGTNHTNFAINADGEFLAIFKETSPGNYFRIDAVTIPDLGMDTAYCRIPNGLGVFTKTTTPTPLSENNLEFNNLITNETKVFNIFPNPCKNKLFIESKDAGIKDIRIFNSSGKEICSTSFYEAIVWDIPNYLIPGLYFIKIEYESNKNKIESFNASFVIE